MADTRGRAAPSAARMRSCSGAVSTPEQLRILAALGAARPLVSATVGDLPLEAAALAAAIHATTAVGVDIVKFGVFAGPGDARRGLAELDQALRARPVALPLVAVLMADRIEDLDAACALARQAMQVQGVAGVMLDTAVKGRRGGRLPDIFDAAKLQAFVAAVHGAGGYAGLAGSLRADDVPLLAQTRADLLGFRGALCLRGRTDVIDAAAFCRVRAQVLSAREARRPSALASNTNDADTCGAAAASSG